MARARAGNKEKEREAGLLKRREGSIARKRYGCLPPQSVLLTHNHGESLPDHSDSTIEIRTCQEIVSRAGTLS